MILNYGTFNKINFSISTDNFLEFLYEFETEIYNHNPSFFFGSNGKNWRTDVVTAHGVCRTFNLALSNDLLNINETSDNFHYQHYDNLNNYFTYPAELPGLPQSDSPFPYGLNIQLAMDIDNESFTENYTYTLYLHDPFEFPSSSSTKFILKTNTEIQIKIFAQIHEIDDSITDYDSKE